MNTQTQTAPSMAESTTAPPPARGRRRRWILWSVFAGLVLIGGLVWVGLRIPPKPLASAGLQGVVGDQPIALPRGLPAPVERFYRAMYGDEVPVVDTAVITGRGTMRINGITLPARFRFSHVTGQSYRHYIENTFLGVPVFTVNEWFTDGTGRMDLPFGVFEGPKIDQGGNLALWAEAVFMPSVWVTDPQARWEPIDDTTARLLVPFDDTTERFTVSFDPDNGLLTRMESMRFKGEEATAKTLWINEVLEWGEIDGRPVPLLTTLTWADDGSPWARLRTEDVLYNVDLSGYIRAAGP
jgi:hypothetical protein